MPKTLRFRDDNGEYQVIVSEDGTVNTGGNTLSAQPAGGGVVRVGTDPARTAWTATDGSARWVFLEGRVFRFEAVTDGPRRARAAHHGTLAAPMPATVVRVLVAAGDPVKRGDTLIILEAMKMELPVRAPSDGVIEQVNCQPGELVQPGTALLELR